MSDDKRIYGIEYNVYATGGVPKRKLGTLARSREIFSTEHEMLKRAIEIKSDISLGDIEMFTTKINKEEYIFNVNS